MFIVLEGIDGCGKSTQATLLDRWLKDNDFRVLLTAEPTKGDIGKYIRKVLARKAEVDAKTLALLFTADRYEHLETTVLPAIEEGKIVVSERYYHSTIAYQYAQGLGWGWLVNLNKFAPKPDVTIVIDVNPAVSVPRTTTSEIFEYTEFLQDVRENYLKFEDTYKIRGDRSINAVFEEIREIVRDGLNIL